MLLSTQELCPAEVTAQLEFALCLAAALPGMLHTSRAVSSFRLPFPIELGCLQSSARLLHPVWLLLLLLLLRAVHSSRVPVHLALTGICPVQLSCTPPASSCDCPVPCSGVPLLLCTLLPLCSSSGTLLCNASLRLKRGDAA